MKLQRKFLSVLIPLVLVPLVLACWLVHRHLQEIAQEHATEQMALLADQARQTLIQGEENGQALLQRLLELPEIGRAELEKFIADHPAVLQIDLVDSQGQRLLSASSLINTLTPFTPANGQDSGRRILRHPGQSIPLLQ